MTAAAKPKPSKPSSNEEKPVTKKIVRKVQPEAATPPHPLHSMIPDEWFATDYVSRYVGNVLDITILHVAAEAADPVLVSGPTGVAKTSFVYAFAAGHTGEFKEEADGSWTPIVDRKLARPLVYVNCNGAADPNQLIGRWTPQPDGSFKFVPGLLLLAAIHGALVYLDEINFMPPRITAFLHGALDKRRVIPVPEAVGSNLCGYCGNTTLESSYATGTERWNCSNPACGKQDVNPGLFELHADTFFVGSYNDKYRGTFEMNEAFRNRYDVQLRFDYDRSIEESFIGSAALLDMAAKLRTAYANGTIRTPVSTNMLLAFERHMGDPRLGFAFAVENFLGRFDSNDAKSVEDIVTQYSPHILNGTTPDGLPV